MDFPPPQPLFRPQHRIWAGRCQALQSTKPPTGSIGGFIKSSDAALPGLVLAGCRPLSASCNRSWAQHRKRARKPARSRRAWQRSGLGGGPTDQRAERRRSVRKPASQPAGSTPQAGSAPQAGSQAGSQQARFAAQWARRRANRPTRGAQQVGFASRLRKGRPQAGSAPQAGSQAGSQHAFFAAQRAFRRANRPTRRRTQLSQAGFATTSRRGFAATARFGTTTTEQTSVRTRRADQTEQADRQHGGKNHTTLHWEGSSIQNVCKLTLRLRAAAGPACSHLDGGPTLACAKTPASPSCCISNIYRPADFPCLTKHRIHQIYRSRYQVRICDRAESAGCTRKRRSAGRSRGAVPTACAGVCSAVSSTLTRSGWRPAAARGSDEAEQDEPHIGGLWRAQALAQIRESGSGRRRRW